MLIHTFHARFKPEAGPADIDRFLAEVRGFQGHIPGLLQTHVGPNLSARSNGFTFGAVMHFTDQEAFKAYEVHPAHTHLLAWAGPLLAAAQDVDFLA